MTICSRPSNRGGRTNPDRCHRVRHLTLTRGRTTDRANLTIAGRVRRPNRRSRCPQGARQSRRRRARRRSWTTQQSQSSDGIDSSEDEVGARTIRIEEEASRYEDDSDHCEIRLDHSPDSHLSTPANGEIRFRVVGSDVHAAAGVERRRRHRAPRSRSRERVVITGASQIGQ